MGEMIRQRGTCAGVTENMTKPPLRRGTIKYSATREPSEFFKQLVAIDQDTSVKVLEFVGTGKDPESPPFLRALGMMTTPD